MFTRIFTLYRIPVCLCLVAFLHGPAQAVQEIEISKDALNPENLESSYFLFPLSEGWRYRSGDRAEWADPAFDDSAWETLVGQFPMLPEINRSGLSWLRLHLRVDSGLWGRPLALFCVGVGACEIYLDGRLIGTFGKVGNSRETEEIRVSLGWGKLIPIQFSSRSDHVLAVRYSNFWGPDHKHLDFPKELGLGLSELVSGIELKVSNYRDVVIYKTLSGVPLAFALLHFLLFLFYPEYKRNLRYAFFTLSISALIFCPFHIQLQTTPIGSLWTLWFFKAALILTMLSCLWFLYHIFLETPPRYFRLLVVIGVVLLVSGRYIPLSYVYIVVVVLFPEILRTVFVAIRRKIYGARIIGIGLASFALGCIYQILMELGILEHNFSFPYIYGILALVVCMSVYLSRSLAQTYGDLKEEGLQRKLLEEELQIAHDMQMGLLPQTSPQIQGVDLSGTCIPANHVGGDYYQFLYLDEARAKLAIVLADVSGHAMQAATVAMRFNEMLRYEIEGQTEPAEILKGLDASLRGHILPEMFVTCGIGVLDVRRTSLTFASAANPEVYRFSKRDGRAQPLGLTGLPLGLPLILHGQNLFQFADLRLESGDVLVFASDGVEEAQDGREGFYEGERLRAVIQSSATEYTSAKEIRDEIIADVKRFMGAASQMDDITVVVLRVV